MLRRTHDAHLPRVSPHPDPVFDPNASDPRIPFLPEPPIPQISPPLGHPPSTSVGCRPRRVLPSHDSAPIAIDRHHLCSHPSRRLSSTILPTLNPCLSLPPPRLSLPPPSSSSQGWRRAVVLEARSAPRRRPGGKAPPPSSSASTPEQAIGASKPVDPGRPALSPLIAIVPTTPGGDSQQRQENGPNVAKRLRNKHYFASMSNEKRNERNMKKRERRFSFFYMFAIRKSVQANENTSEICQTF